MGEQILVFKSSLFDELGYFSGFSRRVERYIPKVLEEGFFVDRDFVEDDPGYKQIIPYAILGFEDKVFRYMRTTQTQEERLHARYSVGIGGHINPIDHTSSSVDLSLLEAAAEREISEEVIIDSGYSSQIIGLINDDSNPVGKVHFGVVFRLTLEEPKVNIRERRLLVQGGFVDMETLLGEVQKHESWSQILITQFLCKR